MVKDLPQGGGAVSPPGLLPIDGVERLIEEEAKCAQNKGPRWRLEVRRAEIQLIEQPIMKPRHMEQDVNRGAESFSYKSSIRNPKSSACYQGGGLENVKLQLDLGACLAGFRMLSWRLPKRHFYEQIKLL